MHLNEAQGGPLGQAMPDPDAMDIDLVARPGNLPSVLAQTAKTASVVIDDDDDDDGDEEQGYDPDVVLDAQVQGEESKTPHYSKMKAKLIALTDTFIKDNLGKEIERRKRGRDDGSGPKNLADEEMSVQDLMKRTTNKKIIDSPRDYQIELFERAKQKNTIAVLDTGTGKTLIAALLIRWMFDQELEHRRAGGQPRVMFFVVGSVALTFQQYNVLRCNLDQSLAQLYGDMNVDQFSEGHWKQILEAHMGVVCTAEVLNQCLMRSFITMDRINLLIFDEAHHAKKHHSFAKIMTQFYHKTAAEKRPRIFGMTASPVDSRKDVEMAAKDLERILDSQIATTRNIVKHSGDVTRVLGEAVQYYKRPFPRLADSELTSKLSACFGSGDFFQYFLRRAREFSRELGEWCGDRYWQLCFHEKAGEKMENEYKKQANKGVVKPMDKQNADMALIQQARAIVMAHHFSPPEILEIRETEQAFEFFSRESANARQGLTSPDSKPRRSISSKVDELRHFLFQHFRTPSSSRCIVFVERRSVAFLLADLFSCEQILNPQYFRCSAMVGTGQTEPGDSPFSLPTQIRTLTKFEKGIETPGGLNCIFATTIAEEGLDIADCNLVVRFDLCSTMIRYIQSRGRARHHNSKYIHMVEAANTEQISKVELVREAEDTMRSFCQRLPEDRFLTGNEADMDKAQRKEERWLKSKTSAGAVLDYHSSLILLHHFVDCLDHPTNQLLQPIYFVQSTGKSFICEVLLPAPSPIRSALGKPYSSKAVAKRSAAFHACLALVNAKYLDAHLMPTIQRAKPAQRNALLALSENKKRFYNLIPKPSFWKDSWGVVPEELYVTILDLSLPGACGRPHVPMAMLTRRKLPDVPNFPIFPRREVYSDATMTRLDLKLSSQSVFARIQGQKGVPNNFQQALDLFDSFTLCLFHHVFAKKYRAEKERMSYWLAPIRAGCTITSTTDVTTAIDWETLSVIAKQNGVVAWSPEMDPTIVLDRLIVDPWSGGRRFFSESVAPEYQPSDKAPQGVRKFKYHESIMSYSCSIYPKRRQAALERFDWSQPVYKATTAPFKRNLLEPWTEKDNKDEKGNDLSKSLAYLCIEPLVISALPLRVVAMAYNLPAFLFKLDCLLVAIEAFERHGLMNINPTLALEAVTKDSDNTHEHGAEQLNMQIGMGNNYERLEFLGDSFLKMATSISLFVHHADDDEFQSHVNRMVMICNKNLLNNALDAKSHEYIRAAGFRRAIWYPEGLCLEQGTGVRPGEEVKPVQHASEQHGLGDKTIADVYEAMIGACLMNTYTGNNTQAVDLDMAVKMVTIAVKKSDHEEMSWEQYYKGYKMPAYQTAPTEAAYEQLRDRCFATLGYKFKYPRLLASAFQHPSALGQNRLPNYQRLEFLGDSLLDMAVVYHLYKTFPDKDPQWLTEHKMAMVSNKFLGFLSFSLGFHTSMRHNHDQLRPQIRRYVEAAEEVLRQNREPDAWQTVAVEPPKCLPDIVEAYLGAIFVDSCFDYREVERFFDARVLPYFRDMSRYDAFANNHPVTFMTNLLVDTMRCQDFHIFSRPTPKVAGDEEDAPEQMCTVIVVHDSVVMADWAVSGRYGRTRVANKFTKDVEGLSPYDFRRKYGCTCPIEVEGDDGGRRTAPVVID